MKNFDRSYDAAGPSARSSAAASATDAILAEKCPDKCPKKRASIVLERPSDPICQPIRQPSGKLNWSCNSTCVWRATIRCVDEWDDTIDDLFPDGEGGVKDRDRDDREFTRRVRCRERVKFDGGAKASAGTQAAKDPDGSQAQKDALAAAENAAHFDARTAALAIRCPPYCKKVRLVVITSPPEAFDKPAKNAGLWEAKGTCSWQATVECLEG